MVEPTLAEIRQFQVTGKLPESLKQRRAEAQKAEKAKDEQPVAVPQAKYEAPVKEREVIHPINANQPESEGAPDKPTMDNTKAEIIAWLEDHGIKHDARRKKEDLLALL